LKKCNKKLKEENGIFECPKCTSEKREGVKEEFKYKFILKLSVADHTGSIRANAFDESIKIIKESAEDFCPVIEKFKGNGDQNSQDRMEAVFLESYFKPLKLVINARPPRSDGDEKYNYIQYTINSVEDINFATENKNMLKRLRDMDL